MHHSSRNTPEACCEAPWGRLNDFYLPKMHTSGALIHALRWFIGTEVQSSFMKFKMMGFIRGRLDCTLRQSVSEQKGRILAGSSWCVELFTGVICTVLCFPLTSVGLKVRGNNCSHTFKNQVERGLNLRVFPPCFDLEFSVP